MARVFFHCDPFEKSAVTLALESGVDGLIVAREHLASCQALARGQVLALEDIDFVTLSGKSDEIDALDLLHKGQMVVLRRGWEVIPVENLLAQSDEVCVEVANVAEAKLASGILERGVFGLVVPSSACSELKSIVKECKLAQKNENLLPGRITRIEQVGLGHRVCVDTMSLLHTGQGMLVGNSSAFTFLVHAETEHNEYVAARPFRINAGAVHAYLRLPGDKTCYLGELQAGREVLVVDHSGATTLATVGRVKIEVRPMLLIEAEVATEDGCQRGTVFVQNAETIRLTAPDGKPLSVVGLSVGDTVLCRLDAAGRHFGMRVSEEIEEN